MASTVRTPQTGGVRIDRRRLARVFLLNRQLTLFGFSPQLIASRERQTSNSELHNYRRSRVDLLFVRRFQLYRVWFVF